MKGHPKKENPVKVTNQEMGLTYYEKVAPKGRIDLPEISYSDYVRLHTEKRKPFDLALSQSELLMDFLMDSVTKRIAPNSTPRIVPLENSTQLAIGSVEIPNALTLNPKNWRSKKREELTSSTDSNKENNDLEKRRRRKRKDQSDLENTSELCDVVRKLASDADDNDENKMKDNLGRFFTIDLGRAFQYKYGTAENFAVELPVMYVDTFKGNDIQKFSKKRYQSAIDHVTALDVKSTVEEIEKKISEFLDKNNMKMEDFLFNFQEEFKRFSTPKDLAYSIGLELIQSKKRLNCYNRGIQSIRHAEEVIGNSDPKILKDIDEAPDFMVAAHIKSKIFRDIQPQISKTDQILEETFKRYLPKDLDKTR